MLCMNYEDEDPLRLGCLVSNYYQHKINLPIAVVLLQQYGQNFREVRAF